MKTYEDYDFEIENTPSNVKRVRDIVKELGFIKIGSDIGRGIKTTYYVHSRDRDNYTDVVPSYFVIQWAVKYGEKFAFSPAREKAGIGCDLKSGRFEKALKELWYTIDMHHEDDMLPILALILMFWSVCLFMTVFTTVKAITEYFLG